MTEENDNRPVHVSFWNFLFGFLEFCGSFTVGVFCILGYQSLSSDLKDESISKWLLAHTILSWIFMWYSFLKVIFISANVGNFVSNKSWKKASGDSSAIKYFSGIGCFITECYFLDRFIKNDSTYANNPDAQRAVDAIAIYFSITLALVGFVIFLSCCLCCTFLENSNEHVGIVEPRIYQPPRYLQHNNHGSANDANGTNSTNDVRAEETDQERTARKLGVSQTVSQTASQSDQKEVSQLNSRKVSRQSSNSNVGTTPEISRMSSITSIFSKAKGLIFGGVVVEECSICLEEFQQDDQWKKLNCNHVFHTRCIDEWTNKNHNSCPYCRQKINLDGPDIV